MKRVLALFTALLCATLLSGCTVNLLDQIGKDNFDIKTLMSAKQGFTGLLEELEFMKTDCYNDKNLAAAQGYTILMSYGWADQAKSTSTYLADQQETKGLIFSEVKQIFYYSNLSEYFDVDESENLLLHTELAIDYCKTMLTYF